MILRNYPYEHQEGTPDATGERVFQRPVSRHSAEFTGASYHFILFTTSLRMAVIFGSAFFATAITSLSVTVFNRSGIHSSETIDMPSTFIP
ncbi:MAG: hypothetical protein AABZ41_06395, partial [Bacteroidota bacterium]